MEPDFPLLGEPPAIELANTRYGAGDSAIDFLADAALARAWLAAVLGAAPCPDPALLRATRDAARALLAARCDGTPFDAGAVAFINARAARACGRVELRVACAGPPRIRATLSGDAVAQLAVSCVEVVAGRDAVRRCEGPGCGLFFVQQHRHRRYCHESCSHRARQARYRRTLE